MNNRLLNLTVVALALLLFSYVPISTLPTALPEGTIIEKLNFIKNPKNFNNESERLKLLFETYSQYQIESSPVLATFFGKPGYDHLWDDISPDGFEKNLSVLKIFDESKNWFNLDELTEDNKVNFNIFNISIGNQYSLNSQFPEQYLILDQIQGIHTIIPTIIQMMPTNSPEAIENIISRLKGIPALLEGVETILSEGIEKGIVMPKNTVVLVPDQLRNINAEKPEESVFYMPFANLEDQEPIQKNVREIIVTSINPALNRFTSFIEEKYLPNTRETYGLKELPNGEAWYNERIKYNTTTDMTAKEIHDLGLSEVARIRLEMQKIISELKFDGDINDFNDFLREDPQFYFDTPEELLAAYRDICKRIDPVLPKLFGKLPRLTYGVKRVPAYSEQGNTTAYYNPGSLQAGIPGYFFANTYNLKSRPKWEMEALSIHEAVPGHHLQIALAQELENVPEFRTMLNFTAFIEGWGLYSESLGPALGMYNDPYSKYGQLTYEMWRAIRLVVDTGIHSFGWSRQDAIDYFKMNSGKSENDITVEVDRYIAWPGQALAYKIGELKIKELRNRSETTLKDKFDIRAFHDVVLGSGSLPLDVLEYNIDNWLNEQITIEK